MARPDESAEGAPGWDMVEELVARLSRERVSFPTATSESARISGYIAGWRFLLETDTGSRWIPLDDVKTCWSTFERLGRIRRQDVLEPGRCSAFMMALFEQLQGVSRERGDEPTLVLAR